MENNVKEISLKVTLDETNLILEGLGNLPFAKVYALVAKIQGQAQQQLNDKDTPGTEMNINNPGSTIKE